MLYLLHGPLWPCVLIHSILLMWLQPRSALTEIHEAFGYPPTLPFNLRAKASLEQSSEPDSSTHLFQSPLCERPEWERGDSRGQWRHVANTIHNVTLKKIKAVRRRKNLTGNIKEHQETSSEGRGLTPNLCSLPSPQDKHRLERQSMISSGAGVFPFLP